MQAFPGHRRVDQNSNIVVGVSLGQYCGSSSSSVSSRSSKTSTPIPLSTPSSVPTTPLAIPTSLPSSRLPLLSNHSYNVRISSGLPASSVLKAQSVTITAVQQQQRDEENRLITMLLSQEQNQRKKEEDKHEEEDSDVDDADVDEEEEGPDEIELAMNSSEENEDQSVSNVPNQRAHNAYRYRRFFMHHPNPPNNSHSHSSVSNSNQLLSLHRNRIEKENAKPAKISTRKEGLPPVSLSMPTKVTAQSWCLIDAHSGALVGDWQGNTQRSPASLTKIMTAHLVIISAKRDPSVLSRLVVVSPKAARCNGTSASLRAGDELSIWQLLHGLMLPSGNDAAIAIAENLGALFVSHFSDSPLKANGCPKKRRHKRAISVHGTPSHVTVAKPAPSPCKAQREKSMHAWVKMMNLQAQKYRMYGTKFTNVHGLSVPNHVSTAKDMATLSFHAMCDEAFCSLVSTKSFKCEVVNTHTSTKRTLLWENTNKLLDYPAYDGVKTGVTPKAGFCLATRCHRDDRSLILVTMGSVDSNSRYVDTQVILRWGWKVLAASS